MKIIQKYFPDLTQDQINKFEKLLQIFPEWNSKINCVSRKNIDELETQHILHSLAIAKVVAFKKGAEVLDVGTGGGFPGIPLAILFPETNFHLVDSIGKKITVVKDVAQQLNLKNVRVEQRRAESIKAKYDFVVSRAVTSMDNFMPWVKGKFKDKNNHDFRNGIIYLKGGDLKAELAFLGKRPKIYPITDYFPIDFFETKKVVYIKM